MQTRTNRWIETDELQIPAIQDQERFELSVLRRVWFRWGRGVKLGGRFTFTSAAFPHEVGHTTPATANFVLILTANTDLLWMNRVTLCAFYLRRRK